MQIFKENAKFVFNFGYHQRGINKPENKKKQKKCPLIALSVPPQRVHLVVHL